VQSKLECPASFRPTTLRAAQQPRHGISFIKYKSFLNIHCMQEHLAKLDKHLSSLGVPVDSKAIGLVLLSLIVVFITAKRKTIHYFPPIFIIKPFYDFSSHLYFY
jgi:hypothetical protein